MPARWMIVVRKAAKASGRSVLSYIRAAVNQRLRRDGFFSRRPLNRCETFAVMEPASNEEGTHMEPQTPQLNVRVDEETMELVRRLAAEHSQSYAGVIRQAVRLLARREGIALPAKPTKRSSS